MIELKFNEVVNPTFHSAIQELWNYKGMDAVSAYRVHRIKLALDKCFKEASELQREIAKTQAKLDDKGEFIFTPRGEFSFDSTESMQKFDADVKAALDGKVVSIKVHKIEFQTMAGLKGLSPSVIGALEPIIENVPEEV